MTAPRVPGPSALEKGLRLGCGGLLGYVLGIVFIVPRLLDAGASPWAYVLVGLPVLLFGFLAFRYGDRFWHRFGAILRPLTQLWPPWR